MFINELFPAPEGPMMAVSSPERNCPFKEFKMYFLPNLIFEFYLHSLDSKERERKMTPTFPFVVLHVIWHAVEFNIDGRASRKILQHRIIQDTIVFFRNRTWKIVWKIIIAANEEEME